MYHPDLSIEPDDRLIAIRENGWGHLGDDLGINAPSRKRSIVVRFGDRLDLPEGRDTIHAVVNDSETQLHIDTIGEITGMADQYALYRNGGQ